MASTRPAQAGDTATPAPADEPAVASNAVAKQEDPPTREQLLAAVEAAAYERAGHDKGAVNNPPFETGE